MCRACRIKNQPLPNKQLLLEEDLLPLMPINSSTGTMSVTQMQVHWRHTVTDHQAMSGWAALVADCKIISTDDAMLSIKAASDPGQSAIWQLLVCL
jgi:hypothetical protein